MNKIRKVLILTADAGFGHRSAAKAIAAALEERYPGKVSVEIVNPLDDPRTLFLLRDSQSDYDKLIRRLPELYRLGYDASDSDIPSSIAESALSILLLEVISDLIETRQPDVVVTTYPLYQSAIDRVLALKNSRIPFLTVVTDLATVHRIWFYNRVDACLVPTPLVRDLAIASGVPEDRVQITGLPVHPDVVHEDRPKADLRRELGWQADLPTVLAVGSRRVSNLIESLRVINHFGQPLQLAVVAGKDHDLYQELEAINWHQTVKLYEFVSNMPTLLHAADLVVCKAGGLMVTEALACGTPLLLVDAIPGQETGNADYVIQTGSGVLAQTPLEVLETLSHWLGDHQAGLKVAAGNARQAGRPQAAFTVAELAWQAAETGSTVDRRLTLQKLADRLFPREDDKAGA